MTHEHNAQHYQWLPTSLLFFAWHSISTWNSKCHKNMPLIVVDGGFWHDCIVADQSKCYATDCKALRLLTSGCKLFIKWCKAPHILSILVACCAQYSGTIHLLMGFNSKARGLRKNGVFGRLHFSIEIPHIVDWGKAHWEYSENFNDEINTLLWSMA